MGQYHIPVNLDKKEYISPHELGDGLKLMEQVLSGSGGTGSALLLLIAASNGDGGRGGGDYHADDPDNIVGRWAGDRVALVGDYAEIEDLPAEDNADLIYDLCRGQQPEMVAKEKREYIVEQTKRYGEPPSFAPEHLAEADRIEKLKAYKNITPQVRDAIMRDGYLRYKKNEWGFMTRGFPGEEGFEDDGAGTYRVTVEPPESGEFEGATEFLWSVKHKNHALNKAKKRGLTIKTIERV